MAEPADLEGTLRLAENVLSVLQEHRIEPVVIGAMALAVHGYPRETADLDLAIAAEPRVLHEVARSLAAKGYDVAVRDPDPDDPLGGVLDVRAPGSDLVQVVNFDNPPSGGFPRLVLDSLQSATPLIAGRPLRVVDPYHLVVFKLYAGGAKSALDILELLDRNPGLDRTHLARLCETYRLSGELHAVLELVGRIS
jgi:hypothetical protein